MTESTHSNLPFEQHTNCDLGCLGTRHLPGYFPDLYYCTKTLPPPLVPSPPPPLGHVWNRHIGPHVPFMKEGLYPDTPSDPFPYVVGQRTVWRRLVDRAVGEERGQSSATQTPIQAKSILKVRGQEKVTSSEKPESTASQTEVQKKVRYTQSPKASRKRPNGYIGVYNQAGLILSSHETSSTRKNSQPRFNKNFWKRPHYCPKTKKFVYGDFSDEEKERMRIDSSHRLKRSLDYIPISSVQKIHPTQTLAPLYVHFPSWRTKNGIAPKDNRPTPVLKPPTTSKVSLPYNEYFWTNNAPHESIVVTPGKSESIFSFNWRDIIDFCRTHSSPVTIHRIPEVVGVVQQKMPKPKPKRRTRRNDDGEYRPSDGDSSSSDEELKKSNSVRISAIKTVPTKAISNAIGHSDNQRVPGAFPPAETKKTNSKIDVAHKTNPNAKVRRVKKKLGRAGFDDEYLDSSSEGMNDNTFIKQGHHHISKVESGAPSMRPDNRPACISIVPPRFVAETKPVAIDLSSKALDINRRSIMLDLYYEKDQSSAIESEIVKTGDETQEHRKSDPSKKRRRRLPNSEKAYKP